MNGYPKGGLLSPRPQNLKLRLSYSAFNRQHESNGSGFSKHKSNGSGFNTTSGSGSSAYFCELSPSHIDRSTPATPPKLEISKSVSAAQLINDAEPVTEETIDQVAEEMNDQVLEAQPVAEQTLDQKEGRIMYQCDKSGHYRPHRPNKQATAEDDETEGPDPKPQEDTTQKRKNGLPNTSTSPKQKVKMPPKNANKTRKTNCPFRATATHNSSTNMWDLEIRNPEHNHGPSDHPTAHLIHQRFTPAQKKEVTKWAEAGVMPLKVKNGMMQDTTTPLYANLRAFHNLNHRERQKNRLNSQRQHWNQSPQLCFL
ncbi:hypothetical protein PSTT_15659 [Puccinia striiformis]|uniref:FAR1 domain-containing protein n=1 Tax=Puccinia striiformis TaxID=27350 RepID=A0A2S4UGK5_9BASI|nr:hypothetical protein PSTT_15659 [Puccinia striiformis]